MIQRRQWIACTLATAAVLWGAWCVSAAARATTPAAPSDVDWGDNVYEPGTAAGKDRRPTDQQTTPRWKPVSNAPPNELQVLEDALRLSTGSAEQPEVGALSFRQDLTGAEAGLTVELTARVVEQRGKSWAVTFLIGNDTPSLIELALGAKHVLLTGASKWLPGDYTSFHTFRITVQPQGETSLVNVYLNGNPEPIQSSSALKGVPAWIRFGDSSVSPTTNGVSEWRSIKWTTKGAFPPPGAASRAQSVPRGALNPSLPVEIALSKPGDRVLLDRYSETEQMVTFLVEAQDLVHLRLMPRRLAIQAGQEYSVNSSFFPPYVIRAERDDELTLKLQGPRNSTVLVEPSPGPNLLPDASFEGVPGSGSGPAWTGRADAVMRANLAYGHESLDDGGIPLPQGAAIRTEALISDAKARTGRRSFVLSKSTTPGNAECVLAQPVAVEAGKEYLLSGWYNLEGVQFGSTMHLLVTVRGEGQKPLYSRDVHLNPLIYTRPDEWRRSFTRFKVPDGYSSAQISISIRGTPFQAYWDDLELRVAPTMVAQFPRQLTAEQKAPRYSPQEVERMWAARSPWQVEVRAVGGGDSGLGIAGATGGLPASAFDSSLGVRTGRQAASSTRGRDSFTSPQLLIDGRPTPLFGFTAGPNAWPGNGAHKDFADAGVHVHWIPLYMAQTGKHKQYGRPVWLDDGQYDFSFLEEQLTRMLGMDPEARILLYLNIDPPYHFGDKHPDAVWVNHHGQKTIGTKGGWRAADKREELEAWNISYTAEAFRRETADALRQMGRFLSQSTVGKALVGIHLTCGSDGQWFTQHYPDHMDRSPGAVAAFRDWLKRQYKTDAALQQAWGDPRITFATVTLPEEAERAPDKLFLDPKVGADQRIIDANRFSSEGVAETINLFARAFKEGIARPALVTTYYHDILHNHMMNHWGLRVLLERDDLDGIISVMDYGLWRSLGRTGCFNSLVSSLRLHNKIYLTEMDYRTDMSWLPNDALQFRVNWGVPQGEEAWAHQIRRDLGMSLARGEGGWIYGLGGNGWINDRYMRGMREANKAAVWAAQQPLPGDYGQIAVFCDERVEDYATRKDIFGTTLAMTGHNTARAALSRSGLSWDPYLLSDLTNPNLPDYKVYIFLSSLTLEPEKIDWIQKNLQKDGRVLVFIHAAGLALGEGFEKNIQRLAGMTVKLDTSRVEVFRFTPAGSKDKLAEGIENLLTESRQPLFYVDDPQATPLALLTNTDKVGMAVRRFADWTSLYISLPGGFTPRTLRAIAAEAGLEPIGPEGDATYAGNGFLVLHAMAPGSKTLRWSEPSDLFDLTRGEYVARRTRDYTFEAEALHTHWFRRIPVERSR